MPVMSKSENINELAAALSKAQGEFLPAKMNAVNPFLKNSYADLGAVIAAAKTSCAKYGLAVSQPASADEGRVTVTTMLMHQSGQWISSDMTLPLGDEKGRSMAQAAGSIITYLRRYSLSAMLGIYADEDTDGNEKSSANAKQSQDAKDAIRNTQAKAEAVIERTMPQNGDMTLEEAMKVTDSKGKCYSTVSNKGLVVIERNITNKMNTEQLDNATQSRYELALEAIAVILREDPKEERLIPVAG